MKNANDNDMITIRMVFSYLPHLYEIIVTGEAMLSTVEYQVQSGVTFNLDQVRIVKLPHMHWQFFSFFIS